MILIIQENRGEINREYYGGTTAVCLTARICLMETLHKARLTAFIILPRNPLPYIKYACGISMKYDEKFDDASVAQSLCGIAHKKILRKNLSTA